VPAVTPPLRLPNPGRRRRRARRHLNRAADLYEDDAGRVFALAGARGRQDPGRRRAELREAVDFLRYYAAERKRPRRPAPGARRLRLHQPVELSAGDLHRPDRGGAGAGNAVLAKPAEQTPLIAARAVDCCTGRGAGDALQLLPGDGPSVGAPLTRDPRNAGVASPARPRPQRLIRRSMADHLAPDAPLIAETGGLNAMIVDSTALPEQAVRDILASSPSSRPGSAARRCAASISGGRGAQDRARNALRRDGGTEALGDPWALSTDVGPVIDARRRRAIEAYVAAMEKGGAEGKTQGAGEGTFVAPHVFCRVKGIEEMDREIFGPVLHVATFKAEISTR
jgi:RHH-type proline utilization regulon transcriptional repressor/proline dehydrogenase/delta 1-pyrroline-5-carboxylate dehydrogenase